MCGACPRIAPDWARPLVSGPIRRAAIARLITGACPGIKVGTFTGGWTVSSRTGATRTTSNFDELLDLAAPYCIATHWEFFDSLLAGFVGDSRPEEFGEYVPGEADDHEEFESVLTQSILAPTYLRLTAFALGIRMLDSRRVGIEFPARAAPFRLIAVNGIILGSVQIESQA